MGGLTVVFNNAGVGSLKPLHTYTPAEFDLLVDVNFKGTFNGLAAARSPSCGPAVAARW